MITKIKLINIPTTHVATIFVCVVRTLDIYWFSKIQVPIHNWNKNDISELPLWRVETISFSSICHRGFKEKWNASFSQPPSSSLEFKHEG